MINTALESSDMIDFAWMATDLSDYANTCEATLSPAGMTLKGREDHAMFFGNQIFERHGDSPLFA